MNKLVVSAALLSTLTAAAAAPDAHADVASDRVLLVTGSTYGCSGATGFKRIRQDPDGGTVTETAEYQVPSGYYLDISSVEYTTPYSTPWALGYVQSLDLNIRRRSGTGSSHVFSARYQNRTVYAGGASFDVTNEYVAPGAETYVATLPDGPLMGTGGRLCVSAASNFWVFGGSVRVRGRLIPTGATVISPTPVNTF